MKTIPNITGATRLYAIIGDPIAQVRSPETITAGFVAAGVNAILIPAHVPAADFDAIVPALLRLGNLDGVLVTIPFKARMLPFANRLGVTAQCIGALNALRREADGSWTGDMFDGAGFVNGAARKGHRLQGRRVALFGAGGAGSAIACALAGAKVASIAIIDTDVAKAAALAGRLGPTFPDVRVASAPAAPRDADLIINATPVGMRPEDGMPFTLGALASDTLIGDVIVSKVPTALIRHAAASGCGWVDGNEMHSGQVAAIVDYFTAGREAATSASAGLQTVTS